MGYIGSGPTKFNTADGLTVTGDAEFTGNASFGDSDKAIFGAGSDLQIYHTGTQSIISDVGSGNLNLEGESKIVLRSAGGSENYAQFFKDGAVELYYDNAVKLATTSTGVDVTGVITTDGMTTSANINFGDSDRAIFGTGSDLQIYHDGSNSYVQENGTGTLNIQGTNLALSSSTGEYYLFGSADGATTLYYDNAAKFATSSAGVSVTGTMGVSGQATFGNDVVLSADAYLYSSNGGSGVRAGLFFDGANQVVKGFTAGSERMRIDSGGNVLFGQSSTTSPGLSNTTQGAVISDSGRLFSSANGAYSLFNRNGSNGDIILFRQAGNAVGSISVTGSSTAYNTSSDYRLKTDVTYDWDATSRLKKLKPAKFDWIADGDDAVPVDGFLAHEVQDIVPEAINGTHNEVEIWTQQQIDDGDAPDGTSAGDNKLDGDGNTIPVMQGIDQSKLVPLLTKALIEAVEKIEQLEARITALETN